MKYIDADKLIANLERQNTDKKVIEPLIRIITSLQKEQSDKPKKNCNNCPHCVDRKDQYGWHFKGCFGGPYNGKFIAEIDECPLKQEQPEVDLKKEIKEWVDLMVGASFPEQDGDFISEEDYRSVIRQTAIHFLGLNAIEYVRNDYVEEQMDTGWISVKDRLPEVGHFVLTCVSDTGTPQCVGMALLLEDGTWWDGDIKVCVDYWMEVPKFNNEKK